jgi:hypothetical protein
MREILGIVIHSTSRTHNISEAGSASIFKERERGRTYSGGKLQEIVSVSGSEADHNGMSIYLNLCALNLSYMGNRV